MPQAIKPIDTTMPKQDNIEIALKERSVAIEAINFIVTPLFLGPNGPRGSIHRTKIFMSDCRASLIESQRNAGPAVDSVDHSKVNGKQQGYRPRGAPSTFAMVVAVIAARSEAA
jgi:hypothetical protein